MKNKKKTKQNKGIQKGKNKRREGGRDKRNIGEKTTEQDESRNQ